MFIRYQNKLQRSSTFSSLFNGVNCNKNKKVKKNCKFIIEKNKSGENVVELFLLKIVGILQ